MSKNIFGNLGFVLNILACYRIGFVFLLSHSYQTLRSRAVTMMSFMRF